MIVVVPHVGADAEVLKLAESRLTANDTRVDLSHDRPYEMEFLSEEALNYGNIRYWHDYVLPELFYSLKSAMTGGDEVIHIDICDLTTLYAAYFATVIRDAEDLDIAVNVTVHDVDQIAGLTLWIKTHPMLKRRLVLDTLNNVDGVFVTSQETAPKLYEAFPKLVIDLIGAPNTDAAKVPGDEPLSSS